MSNTTDKIYRPRQYGHVGQGRTIISASVSDTVATYLHQVAAASGLSMSRWLVQHFAEAAAAHAAAGPDRTERQPTQTP